MDFKFDMGAKVRVRLGKMASWTGTVTARIECPNLTPCYRIIIGNGNQFEVREKNMWLVSRIPRWLRLGAKIQWMGEGTPDVYEVVELAKGSRHRHARFIARRDAHERISSSCAPEDLKFWRPIVFKRKMSLTRKGSLP